MSHIELIGLSGETLEPKQLFLLRNCRAVAVSRRHRPLFENLSLSLLDMTPISAMLAQVEEHLRHDPYHPVAIVASGDPLCFGIGRKLLEHFGAERIRVHPAISSLQLACARFHLPWDDLPLLSLHGRKAWDIPGQILRHKRVLLFTDPQNSPDRIAALLRERLSSCKDHDRLHSIHMRVAENLGLSDERLVTGKLSEIATQRFSPLNLALVERPESESAPLPSFVFGLQEADLSHSRGLITKDEVRAATLHCLRLPTSGVLWDIGGGSGSISIEAARLCPNLHICIVERSQEQLDHIQENIRRFGSYNIQVIPGEAPKTLAGLPEPDRIFIGGSGGRLSAIITAAAAQLKSGGRMLINTVRDESEKEALSCLRQLGFLPHSSRLAVDRRSSHDSSPHYLNPITLIVGDK